MSYQRRFIGGTHAAWMCKGKTKQDKPCRGTPLRGSEYCGQHQDQRRLSTQSKKWTSIKAIPTEYRGILMRSRLEASFARALDRAGVSWVYEPRCFEGPEGRWLADFNTDRYGYVELKPFGPIGSPGRGRQMMIEQQMARMSVARRTEPGAVLTMIFWEYGLTLAEIPLLLQNRQGVWSIKTLRSCRFPVR